MLLGMTYYQICWYFLLYSFIGWVVEVIFHAVTVHKVINRGFLNGPVCPVYGFGVICVFGAAHALADRMGSSVGDLNVVALFFLGMFLSTAVELVGGFMLDVCFHARWWDYRDRPLNFHGYICLSFSIIWGLAIVVVVKLAHPFLASHSVDLIPPAIGWWILALLYAAYLADFIVTVLFMLKLNRRIAELEEVRKSMRVVSDALSKTLGEGTFKAEEVIGDMPSPGEVKEAAIKAAENATEAVKETAGAVRDTVKGTTGALRDTVKGTTDAMLDGVKGTTESMKETAKAASQLPRRVAGRTIEELNARKDALEKRYAQLREATYEKHPVMRRILTADPHFKLPDVEILGELRQRITNLRKYH